MDRDLFLDDMFGYLAERINELGAASIKYGISARNLLSAFESLREFGLLEFDDNIELDIKDDEISESQELNKFLSEFKIIKEQEVY